MTARFNINLLRRINRELGGDLALDAFRHRARWINARARIEMHLEAVRNLAPTVAGRPFAMRAGETIYTESSHKYDPRSARLSLEAGGWSVRREWQDKAAMFGLTLAKAVPETAANR